MQATTEQPRPDAPISTVEYLFEQGAAQSREATRQWLGDNGHTLPEGVAKDFGSLLHCACLIDSAKTKHRALIRSFKRALGIIPSSEKRRGSANTKRDPDQPAGKPKKGNCLQRLMDLIKQADALAAWHRKCARRHKRKVKDAQKKLMEIEDIELSAEEEAEIEREGVELAAHCNLGGGPDPQFASHVETLMEGANQPVRTQTAACKVDLQDLPKGAEITRTFTQPRERIDFSFSLTKLDIEVEKAAVKTRDGLTTLLTGDIEAFGPLKSRVTWNFLAHMAILTAQYVMPFHRFARITSSPYKRFCAGEISRYFYTVASHFTPIYVHLGQALAQAPVLVGDDTPSLVLEVTRGLEKGQQSGDTGLPWDSYASHTAASAHLAEAPFSMAHLISQAFGFASPRKDGKGDKKGFNTTTLSGRTDAADPKSTIIFYRSHLGGMGNLLDAILPLRHADNRALVVQSDLSTVNLVSDRAVLARLDIVIAGCVSHARRPFAIHTSDEPDTCKHILHCFKAVPIHEHLLDLHGRNAQNVVAVRGGHQKQHWDTLHELCTDLTKRWSRATPLGEGARYVLRHFERLTYYLNDPRVSPTNNFSERMLRLEKLIARNSLFRQTLQGRFALDIMRTIFQTCIAAQVDLAAYVIWIMRMPQDAVSSNPGAFTPLQYAQWRDANATEDAEKIS